MAKKVHSYDVHGEVTVVSDVSLPELARFRATTIPASPTIRVSIPSSGAPWVVTADDYHGSSKVRRARFHDGLSRAGFGMEIVYGAKDETIEIKASPLLAHSPHVLYTNVVEAVLRWKFVERGYALVHGACVSVDDRAYLITARTDTGKTTTILRLLDNYSNVSFLSDDLTLIRPDGAVFSYPKPLTISAHTVVAVNSPLLSRRERMTLPIQSRLHSKSGRFFGMLLARTKLPMATMNAIVQMLVPPPKYHVERLVPHSKPARNGVRLAGLFVIERGDDAVVTLSDREAADTLLANSDDAYGFPPYADIKEVLYTTGSGDLRPEERSIVESALAGLPATLIKSSTRDWWKLIPEYLGIRSSSVPEVEAPSNAVVEPSYEYVPQQMVAEPSGSSAD